MNLTWKARTLYLLSALGAVLAGVLVANDDWIALVLLLVAIFGSALAAFSPVALPRAIFGVLIFGYILGNRGFAQLSPSSGLPLFPAELALAFGGAILLVQSTAQRRIPLRRDSLNVTILFWCVLGAARIGFDFHAYGFDALRDFAMIYYAVFFFLAQAAFEHHANPSAWLHVCLLIATALLFPLYILFDRFPHFFLDVLTFRGVPLIYYKGDLVGTNLTIGAVAWFIYYEQARRRWWALLMSLLLVGAMFTTSNRSSALALLVAASWLGISGRWRMLRTIVVCGILGTLCIVFWAKFANRTLQDTPLQGAYEEAASLLDPTGRASYSGSGTSSKGDNNRFRVVWWRTVIDDTIAKNPLIGLGFGYDLADEFLRVYYPDSNDDFRARSPHSIVVTVFARMGVLGLLAFLAVVVSLIRPTRYETAIRSQLQRAVPWCTAWAILTSALFGVVLEGPMGAVLFWSALGIGNASRHVKQEEFIVEGENAAEFRESAS